MTERIFNTCIGLHVAVTAGVFLNVESGQIETFRKLDRVAAVPKIGDIVRGVAI